LHIGCWLLVVGCWLLVVGCWLLVVGCWLLVINTSLQKLKLTFLGLKRFLAIALSRFLRLFSDQVSDPFGGEQPIPSKAKNKQQIIKNQSIIGKTFPLGADN
jgi:hypothetical protein